MCVFKQKTAYEMRISDWSSDVCSSDLHVGSGRRDEERAAEIEITDTLLLKDIPCTLRDRAGDQHGDSLASPVHLVEIVPQLPDLLADVPGKELALRFDHQLELLVVEPHIEQSIRGIARADALLSGALMHGKIGRAPL